MLEEGRSWLGGREDDGGLGWPALSSAYGPLSSTTTAGTTHQLLSRHQEGKMEEGTKRLEREVSSSTVRRVQTILEITSPKPLIAQSRTEAQNVQFHQPNKEAEFPWHNMPGEVHTLYPGCSSENLPWLRLRAWTQYLCSDLALKPASEVLHTIPLLLICAPFWSDLSWLLKGRNSFSHTQTDTQKLSWMFCAYV